MGAIGGIERGMVQKDHFHGLSGRGQVVVQPIVFRVEEAAEYLFDHGIPAYPYSTEMPVMVLGAKYKWARGAGLI